MSHSTEVTCKLNVTLTVYNPYRTLLSHRLLCEDPCQDADLITKFRAILMDSDAWDDVLRNGLTVVGDYSDISRSELKAAPLVSGARSMVFTTWP